MNIPASREVRIHELQTLAVAVMNANEGIRPFIAAKLHRDFSLDITDYTVVAALSILATAQQYGLPAPENALAVLGCPEASVAS